jgi:aspartate aminotransferase-like enzyme
MFKMLLAAKGAMADISAMGSYQVREMRGALAAFENTLLKKNSDEDLIGFSNRRVREG